MTSSPRPRIVVHLSLPKVPPGAVVSAASADPAAAAAAAAGDDDGAPPCGWYDSSFALRQGLVVSELSDSDASLTALWFGAADSHRLQ